MAGEIQTSYQHGKTLYALIRNAQAQVYSTVSQLFENYTTANYANYVVSLTEQGTNSSYYVGTFPATIPGGIYSLVVKLQAGGGPLESDATTDAGDLQWNGVAPYALNDIPNSGFLASLTQPRIQRDTMVKNFPLLFLGAADHVTPVTSGVVSGQIARDGGSFGPLQSGAFTENGQGFYWLQALTSGDLHADTIELLFTCAGVSGGQADPVRLGFVLQRSSGH